MAGSKQGVFAEQSRAPVSLLFHNYDQSPRSDHDDCVSDQMFVK